jgi:hypothetical protein
MALLLSIEEVNAILREAEIVGAIIVISSRNKTHSII